MADADIIIGGLDNPVFVVNYWSTGT